MKRLTFFFMILSGACAAQDYRGVVGSDTAYFRIVSVPHAPLFPQLGNNFATWSDIKVAQWDSVIAHGTDSNYYGFRTWRDTTTIPAGVDCADSAGPLWISDAVISASSMNYFFNYYHDTIAIVGSAGIGDSWTFSAFSNGAVIRASVDSAGIQLCAGISDSCKYITLTELDSTGLPVASSYITGIQLILSKSHGLFRTICFREFPSNIFILDRIQAIPLPTQMDLFDFNINDEFEYREDCVNTIPFPSSSPPSYHYDRILNKWYSPGQDTVYWVRFRRTLNLQFNSTPVPHFDSLFYSRTDTLYVTNALLFSTFAEENTSTPFGYGTFSNYTLSTDTARYNNRPVFSFVDGSGFMIFSSPDSCYLMNHFEPAGSTQRYSPGLGLSGWINDDRYVSGTWCEGQLIWYHKGVETWGTYVDIPTGITEAYDPVTGIFPNPARESVRINFLRPTEATIVLSDLAGKRILEEKSDAQSIELNVQNLASGMYVISVQTALHTSYQKLIKQ